MNNSFLGWDEVDVLIITAIKDEYRAVCNVDTGAVPGSNWTRAEGQEARDRHAGFEVAFRGFCSTERDTLRIGATYALGMGSVAAASAAAYLVCILKPRCLAMCGVCAGRKGDVNLGDVIIADRLWQYDAGATCVERDSNGHDHTVFKADPVQYNLTPTWMHPAQGFFPGREGEVEWLKLRPYSYDDQTDWLMVRLHEGKKPDVHPDRNLRCRDYDKVITLLRERGWLQEAQLALSDEGNAIVSKKLALYPDGLPERQPFCVKVGPIGTGTSVIRDAQIFDRLSERMRKVLGLEMEAAAIASIAHHFGIKSIVMKGVMDYADPTKDDNFKDFAARAAAECLIAFLRQHLRPNWSADDTPSRSRSSNPRIDTDIDNNYCLTDASGKYITIPWLLPSLSAPEVAVAAQHAGDWKKLHTCAENCLRCYTPLHEQIIRSEQSLRSNDIDAYDRARGSAGDILKRMPGDLTAALAPLSQIERKSDKLEVVEAVLKRLSSATLRNVFAHYLAFSKDDPCSLVSVKKLSELSETIQRCILFGTLTMADQILEKHFANCGRQAI